MPQTSGPPRSGRPRDPANDTAILAATLLLLGRDGYSGMSLQAVADSAGTSKATIHLRWKTKLELVLAALKHMRSTDYPPLAGHTRGDLVTQLRWYAQEFYDFSIMGILGSCMAEESAHPELMRLLREGGARPRLQHLRTILDAAKGRQEIPADADVETAARLLFGLYYADYIAGDASNDLTEGAVGLVLAGLHYHEKSH